jgi:hypothetical protein
METQEQFLESLKRATPFHSLAIATVLGALLIQARTGAEFISIGALGVGYAALIAAGISPLRKRFDSDAWIYGMIAAEAGLFAFAFHTFGPITAAMAFAPIVAIKAGLFLGYIGAGVSVALLGVALVPGLVTSGWSIAASLELVAIPTIVVAVLTVFISYERLVLRTGGHRMDYTISGAMAERILNALHLLKGVSDRHAWSTQMVASIGTVSGFGASAVYFQSGADSDPERIAKSEGFDEPAARIDSALHTAIGTQRKQSFRSTDGLLNIVPFGSHSATRGAIVIRSEAGTQGVADRVDNVERLIALALPYLERVQDPGVGAAGAKTILERELAWTGRSTDIDSRKRPIELDGITLDPVNEKSIVGDVAISLSRTEFDLLYELASSPGATIAPESLAESIGASTSVDVIVHRLRRKLANAPTGGDLIKTVRGKGYMLVPPAIAVAF